MDVVLADLEAAVEQLPYHTCGHEAEIVANVLQKRQQCRRGVERIGDVLPAVLARLNVRTVNNETINGDRS